MSEAVKEFVADLLDAWNDHDVERVAGFYAPDYQGLDVAEAGPQHGPDGICQSLRRYLSAFPDLEITAESVVAEADRVALAWTARGTHQGRLLNIPATGRPVTLRGVTLLVLEDGKVVRGCQIWDVAGLLRAIGLLPELS